MSKKAIKNSLIPYSAIVLAVNGDVDAISTVLRHYESYIAALATRRCFDEGGNPHLHVDEGLRRRLENKLITAILKFDAE